MAKKRKNLAEKKFTLADVDKTLADAQRHLEQGDIVPAKRMVNNARKRLDIARGVPRREGDSV